MLMNKKIIRFIKNNWLLILLFNFVAFFGYAFGKSVSVNAYSLNSDGNVVSDNILYIENKETTTINGITYSINNGLIKLNGTSNIAFGLSFNSAIELKPNTQYSYAIYEKGGTTNQNFYLYDYTYNRSYGSIYTSNISSSFTTPNEIGSNVHFDCWFDDNFYIDLQFKIMIIEGNNIPLTWEPYGVWLSDYNVDNLLANSLNISSVSASWNGGALSDASSYIYNKDGLVWVDGVFDYITGKTPSGYSDADVSIVFGTRMPTNVNYSYSFIESIGSSVSFYQGNSLIYSINVTDDVKNLCSSVPTSNLCIINLADKIDVKQYTYFDKVVLWSSNYDHRPLSFGYYSSSFYSGYNKGYSDGYDVGYSNGSSSGYNNGYKRGYDIGFNAGVLHQENNGPNTLVGLVSAIFSGPVTMFQTIFDFNFLGINLSQFFFSLISLLIVVWLIIKFL